MSGWHLGEICQLWMAFLKTTFFFFNGEIVWRIGKRSVLLSDNIVKLTYNQYLGNFMFKQLSVVASPPSRVVNLIYLIFQAIFCNIDFFPPMKVILKILGMKPWNLQSRGPFHWQRSTLIPAWISNHMPIKMWDEIIYPCQNFHSFTIDVWELTSDFIPHL